MTQICEHEDIHCPYCHSDGVKDIGKSNVSYDTQDYNKKLGYNKKTIHIDMRVHVLQCLHCNSVFTVSCED